MRKADRSYYYGHSGQRFHIQEWGAIDAPVMMLVHGFPGCADQGMLMTTSPHVDGIRLIAIDRPGYGRSDLQKKLTPLKFAEQIRDFLNDKKIEQLSILSVSGGAPFAMALAYVLGDRVKKMTSVAGVAPFALKNMRYMNSQQRKGWVLRNFIPPMVFDFAVKKIWKKGIEKIDTFLFTEMDSFSEADRKVFEHPEVGPLLVETLRTALQQGPGGVLHDMKVYSRSWGFPLSEIKCPVTLWHGLEDDVVHSQFSHLMKGFLPNAKIKLEMDEGHYSLPMNRRDEILADLLDHPR